MSSNRILIIFVVAVLGIATAEVVLSVVKRGECPTDIKVVSDFEVDKYMDYWYEYAKYPNIFEQGGKCNTAYYRLEADGRVQINNTMINEETGVLQEMVGYGVQAEYTEGQLKFVFPVNQTYSVSYNYWILDTDYRTYSVAYSCQQMMDHYTTYVWILTRELNPPMKIAETPLAVLRRNHISLESLEPTLLEGCIN